MPDPKPQPTPEETQAMQQAMQQVAVAGATAAAAGEDAGPPMRAERDRQKAPLTDEEIDKIATALNTKNIESLRELGAFDPPPEPVRAPEQQQAPSAPGEQPPAGEQPPPAPEKRTWAHKFMGM